MTRYRGHARGFRLCPSRTSVLTVAVLTVAACESKAPPEQPAAASAEESLPARKTAADGSTLQRVRPPADYPVQFTTYAPPNVQPSFETDNGNASITFRVSGGTGEGEDAPFMHVFILPPDGTMMTAENIIMGYMEGRNAHAPNVEPGQRFPWATEDYAFSYRASMGEDFAGDIAISNHAGRPFYLYTHYPKRMGAEVEQRLIDILGQWTWEDGSRLTAR